MNYFVPPPRGVRVLHRSRDDIKLVAQKSRLALDIIGVKIDIVDLLENKLRERGIHFHVEEDDDMAGDIARAAPAQGVIRIGTSAYLSLTARELTHALVVPHELGHIALRHDFSFARATTDLPHLLSEDSEWQAEYFAHEFLMPWDLVQHYCRSVADIERKFEISRQDAEMRAFCLRRERLIGW